MSEAKAFAVRVKGFGEVVFFESADTAEQARGRVVASAQEVGYKVRYTDVTTKRVPELDVLAQSNPGEELGVVDSGVPVGLIANNSKTERMALEASK